MFGVYFGKYLQDIGVLSAVKYDELIDTCSKSRVKMGLIAVNEGLMTIEQAEEINRIQAVEDKRFGDIAVVKGYLTDEQVSQLLKKQGDSYLLFVQALVESGILNLEDIQKYLNRYKKTEHLTALDLDAIKSSDIDKIIPIFVKDGSIPTPVKDYVALLARNIVRFVDNKVRFDKIERISSYTSSAVASQSMTGDYEMFIGTCGRGNMIIGQKYANEEFERIDEDCLDSVAEFINITNGLFASKLSIEEVFLELNPPQMFVDQTTIRSEGNMFRLPCCVKGEEVDVVICMETMWSIC